MKIIPVIDVLGGQVVHAIGGRREEYRPIVSRLTTSTAPMAVAQALLAATQARELYLADLDAIAGAGPDLRLYRQLASLGAELWVDAGIRGVAWARDLARAGATPVAGLETLPDPKTLQEIVTAVAPAPIIFSLDLRAGKPLTTWAEANSPEEIVSAVASSGVQRLILLDLARVGTGQGTGTEDLCRRILAVHPGMEIYCGGGIASRADIEWLGQSGIHGVLVATALHDGRLAAKDK